METIFIEGRFSKGSNGILARFSKVHGGASPHIRTVGSQSTLVGGEPMELDAAIADELQLHPGSLFQETSRIVTQ